MPPMKDLFLAFGWFLAMGAGRLPLILLWRLGALLGWALYWLPNESRRVTQINISLCFPQLSEQEQRQLVKQSLIEDGRLLLELLFLWSQPPKQLLDKVVSVEGEELLTEALAKNRGVLIALPHLGAWELAAVYCAQFPGLTALYKPGRIEFINERIKALRQRAGMQLFATDKVGVKALFKALKEGAPVIILPDQVPPKGTGELVDFCGEPAYCTKLYSRLAQVSQAPTLLLLVTRDIGSRGFRIQIRPISNEIYSSDLQTSIACLNQSLESAIRQLPEQYLWNYKRFTSRPSGLPKVYKK